MPVIFPVLTGCMVTLPVSFEDVTVSQTIAREVRPILPTISLAMHPDGLGWQVTVTQLTVKTIVTDGEERRGYRVYELSSRNAPGQPDTYDDLCGVAVLATPFFAPFDLDSPPFWTTWDRFFSACKRTASTSGAVKRLLPLKRLREQEEYSVEAVTTGHLALSWESKNRQPLLVLIPLEGNVRSIGVPVRLRWLAELMRRKGIEPGQDRDGQVELQLLQGGQLVVRKILTVSDDHVAAALEDHQVVSVSADRWPTPLVVRIEREPTVLEQGERAYLVSQAAYILSRLSVPLVIRGQELDELQAERAKSHLSMFIESLAPSLTQMKGANVLLHIDVHTRYPQSRFVTLRLVDVTSGEVLAQIMNGGHESQWKFVVDTSLMQLETTIQQIMNHPKSKSTSDSP
jgi:hypothetical protein